MARKTLLRLTCSSLRSWQITYHLLALCGSSIVLFVGIALFRGGVQVSI